MESIESRYVQITLVDDEVDIFKTILDKLKANSNSVGFKKTYTEDEQDVIAKLHTIVIEKKNY